jgi:hypothetical protein
MMSYAGQLHSLDGHIIISKEFLVYCLQGIDLWVKTVVGRWCLQRPIAAVGLIIVSDTFVLLYLFSNCLFGIHQNWLQHSDD